MTDARDTLRLRSVNGSPAVECRRTNDGGVECRYLLPDGTEGREGAPWLMLPDHDIRRQIEQRTPIGSWIMAQLTEQIGHALWGETWQLRMADALGVPKRVVQDMARGKTTLRRDDLAMLHVLLHERRVAIDHATEALRSLPALPQDTRQTARPL